MSRWLHHEAILAGGAISGDSVWMARPDFTPRADGGKAFPGRPVARSPPNLCVLGIAEKDRLPEHGKPFTFPVQ